MILIVAQAHPGAVLLGGLLGQVLAIIIFTLIVAVLVTTSTKWIVGEPLTWGPAILVAIVPAMGFWGCTVLLQSILPQILGHDPSPYLTPLLQWPVLFGLTWASAAAQIRYPGTRVGIGSKQSLQVALISCLLLLGILVLLVIVFKAAATLLGGYFTPDD